jgi:hypothetical protein
MVQLPLACLQQPNKQLKRPHLTNLKAGPPRATQSKHMIGKITFKVKQIAELARPKTAESLILCSGRRLLFTSCKGRGERGAEHLVVNSERLPLHAVERKVLFGVRYRARRKYLPVARG